MFATSLAAEHAFYEAFSKADLGQMMRVWAPHGDVACIHPSGPRLEGRAAIQRSWELILSEQTMRSFTLRGRIVIGAGDCHAHTLEERITVPGTMFVAPPVLATNVYQRIDDSWYIVLHHAGVSPVALHESPFARNAPGNPAALH